MYQFLRVNLIVVGFMFFASPLSFGMHQALCEFEKAPLDMQRNIINCLDDPVIFGKTSKFMHALVKKTGERNLKRLYKNQDLDFAKSFLLSRYVPVLLINDSDGFDQKSRDFFRINPYEKSFYGYNSNDYISEEVRQKYWKIYERALQQKKDQYEGCSTVVMFTDNDTLIQAVIFGTIEDVCKELKAENCEQQVIKRSILTLLSCKPGNINLLETLLLALKKKQLEVLENYAGESEIMRGFGSYQLLFLADRSNNKKAFDLLADIDPYLMNKQAWRKSIRNNEVIKTNLDRMIEDGNFNPENIEIFKKYGALTTKQAIAEGRLPKNESYNHVRGNFSAGTITVDYNGDGSIRDNKYFSGFDIF